MGRRVVEPAPSLASQANRIFERFGGVRNLRSALKRLADATGNPKVVRSLSALYRWNLPRPTGSGGLVPTCAIPDVLAAARLEGIVFTVKDAFVVEGAAPESAGLPPIAFFNAAVEGSTVDRDRICGPFLDARQFFQHLDDQRRAMQLVVDTLDADSPFLLERLRRRFEYFRRYVAFEKMPRVVAALRSELAAGEYQKVVALAADRELVNELHHGLAKFGAVKLHRTAPRDHRLTVAQTFQTDRQCRVLCADVIAAGVAGPLTAANELVFADADWAPERNAQAIAQLHRAGQVNPVRVRFFSVANSVDRGIQTALMQATRALIRSSKERA